MPGARRISRAAIAALTFACAVVRAEAQESAYCATVRGRADVASAPLLWPRVVLEGLRFPLTDGVVTGPTLGNGFQARAGLSWSPTDLYRGIVLSRAARADCELHEVLEPLRAQVEQGGNPATLRALRAQRVYLESHRSEWQQILARSRDRLAAGLITVLDVEELRRLVGTLERKLEAVRGDEAALGATLYAEPSRSTSTLADAFVDRAVQLERESSHLAGVDAFRIGLTAGVIPAPNKPIAWFGVVEVSFSLGAVGKGSRADETAEAREWEVRTAKYELPARAARSRALMRAQAAKARSELQVIDGERSSIASTLRALDGSNAPDAERARAYLETEQISLESDRVFLTTLVGSMSPLVEDHP